MNLKKAVAVPPQFPFDIDWVSRLCRTTETSARWKHFDADKTISRNRDWPEVCAAVLCQPVLPIRDDGNELGLADDDLKAAVLAIHAKNMDVLGLRFEHDHLSPPLRFCRLQKLLGARFHPLVVKSPPGDKSAHSVLGHDFDKHPGANQALELVRAYLAERLYGQHDDHPVCMDDFAECDVTWKK